MVPSIASNAVQALSRAAPDAISQRIAVAVLDKALDVEAQAAAAMVQTLLPPAPTSGAVGRLLDVRA